MRGRKLGHFVSEETKLKISKKRYGKKASVLTREKMSETHKKLKSGSRLPVFIGENNPNWKGGITPLTSRVRRCFKNRQWISDIFTRDDYTCANCGARSGNGKKVILNAHHIEAFSDIMKRNGIKTLEDALVCEELWNINNGVTLCKNCHN